MSTAADLEQELLLARVRCTLLLTVRERQHNDLQVGEVRQRHGKAVQRPSPRRVIRPVRGWLGYDNKSPSVHCGPLDRTIASE